MSRRISAASLLKGIMVALFLLTLCGVFPYDAGAQGKTAVITAGGVNVRSGPGTNYSKVGTVNKGQKFDVLQQKNGWFQLKLANGTKGWVTGSLLKVSDQITAPGGSQSASSSSTAKTVIVKSDNVNLRGGPGTGFAKVGKVNKGQQFSVLKESGGWFYISPAKGKNGWIYGQLVTIKNPPAPAKPVTGSTGGTGTKTGGGTQGTSPSGGGNSPVNVSGKYLIIKSDIVNVRTGAGTNFAVVAKVKAGERFTVLKQSGQWYLVKLTGDKQGWIAGWLAEVWSSDTPSRGETGRPGDNANPGGSSQEPGNTNPPPAAGGDQTGQPSAAKITSVEMKTTESGEEQLVVKSAGELKYSVNLMKDPARLVVDIQNSDANGISDVSSNGNLIGGVRVAQYSLSPMVVRVVLDLNKPVSYGTKAEDGGKTLIITVSEPSINGKKIVIDAGHGGYDPGAIGVTGMNEKDFNLETALKLRDKLTAMGATVIMTRQDDTFVSLTERAAVANRVYADVFIAIHANSSESSSLRGSSTYFYAPSSNPVLYAQLAQRQKLARAVQNKLVAELGTRDIGTLQANFAVLRGTNMPSILVETAFVSNAADESMLKESEFRDKAAQAIADGVSEYFAN